MGPIYTSGYLGRKTTTKMLPYLTIFVARFTKIPFNGGVVLVTKICFFKGLAVSTQIKLVVLIIPLVVCKV